MVSPVCEASPCEDLDGVAVEGGGGQGQCSGTYEGEEGSLPALGLQLPGQRQEALAREALEEAQEEEVAQH